MNSFLFFLETEFTPIPLTRRGTPIPRNFLGAPLSPTPILPFQEGETDKSTVEVAYDVLPESNPIPLFRADLVQSIPLDCVHEEEISNSTHSIHSEVRSIHL